MEISPNWKRLSSQLGLKEKVPKRKERESKTAQQHEASRVQEQQSVQDATPPEPKDLTSFLDKMFTNKQREKSAKPGKYIAIHCSYVGIASKGIVDALGRISLVNYHGKTVLDTYVKPGEKITDYRTNTSGIGEAEMKDAKKFTEVQEQVSQLIANKVIIGYDMKKILQVLLLNHPKKLQRNISTFPTFSGEAPIPLKRLAVIHLSIPSSMLNKTLACPNYAQICMLLYHKFRLEWEATYKKEVRTPVIVRPDESSLFSSDSSDSELLPFSGGQE